MGLTGQIESAARVATDMGQAGIVAILLFLLLAVVIGVGGFGWYVVRRCFDPDTGIVTTAIASVVHDHRAFLNAISIAVDEQKKLAKKAGSDIAVLRQVIESSTDAEQLQRAKDLSKLWRFHVNWLRAASKNFGILDEVALLLDAMDKIVNPIDSE